jgi:hypothetical protein
MTLVGGPTALLEFSGLRLLTSKRGVPVYFS